jgi:excisionase family DNA binding protein
MAKAKSKSRRKKTTAPIPTKEQAPLIPALTLAQQLANQQAKRKPRVVSPNSPFIPVKELAAETGLGIQAIYKALEAGQIRGTRIGKRWVVPRTERNRLLCVEPPAMPAAAE